MIILQRKGAIFKRGTGLADGWEAKLEAIVANDIVPNLGKGKALRGVFLGDEICIQFLHNFHLIFLFNCVFEPIHSAFKIMDFGFKMMNFGRLHERDLLGRGSAFHTKSS